MADRYRENADRFKRINSLYNEYISIVGRDNVENAITTKRDDIIVTTFEVFSPKHLGLKDNDAKPNKIPNADFPDVIVEKVLGCLKSFPESNACKTGGKFSQYLCVAVDNALKAAKNEAILSNKNAGTKISENDIRLANKIRKFDSDLKKLGFYDEQKRNEKIATSMELPIEKVEFYKKMNSNTSVSLEAKKNNDSEMILGDRLEDKSVGMQSKIEDKVILEKYFEIIQEEWSKEKDKLLSEILTVYFLRKGVDEKYLRYSCFDKSMVESFFGNHSYQLPEDQDIAKRAGISKSAISKKRERFLEKCRKRMST